MRIWKKVLSVMLVVVMCITVLPVSYITAADSMQIPNDAVEYDGNFYKLFEEGKTWYEAKVACEDMGGHLVTINSVSENAFLTQLLTEKATKNCYWTGITYDHTSKAWINYDGTSTEKGNWAENEPNDYDKMGEVFVHLFGKRFVGIGEKPIGSWNDSSANGAAYAHPFYAIKNFGYICEWAQIAEEPEEPTKIFPDGYDFEVDSYEFPNIEETVSKDIYVRAYGNKKGRELYADHENGEVHGNCYGMAGTTAAMIEHPVLISSFIKEELKETMCSTIREINPESKSLVLNDTAKNYIKYMQISQYDEVMQEERNANLGRIEELYKAVKLYVMGEGSPVVINVFQYDEEGKRKNGHAFLAIGLLEKDDRHYILVNDSNFPLNIIPMEIDKTFSSWSFGVDGVTLTNGDPYQYNQSNGTLNYCCPSEFAYYLGLCMNDDLQHFLSKENHLIRCNRDILTKNALTEILPGTETSGGNSQKNNKLYWMEDNVKKISLEALENDTEITVSDTNSSVKVELDKADKAEFYVDDESNSYVYFDTAISDNVEIEFSSADSDGEIIDITVSGTASADEITATQTDTGLVVTGIDKGTITLTQDDEVVATKRITEATGDVEITYDATGETTDLDAQFPHECDDYNHNGKCDICTEVMEAVKNCDCMCHKSGFMSLVYAFVNLFWRLFGTNKACECGVHHW